MSTQHIAHVWPGKKDVAAFLVTFITTHTVHLEMASTLKKSELMSRLQSETDKGHFTKNVYILSLDRRLGEVCSHVAAILFKIEVGVKLGLTKTSSTSEACKWNKTFREKVSSLLVIQNVLVSSNKLKCVYGNNVEIIYFHYAYLLSFPTFQSD